MVRDEVKKLSLDKLMAQWNAARNTVADLKKDVKELNAAKREAMEREAELAEELSARHLLKTSASGGMLAG